MPDFLELILEGIVFGHKKTPKAKLLTVTPRVSRTSNWQDTSIKPRYKRLIPKKLSMMGSRKLINDTNKTRVAWDPKGYAEQKFLQNIYKKL